MGLIEMYFEGVKVYKVYRKDNKIKKISYLTQEGEESKSFVKMKKDFSELSNLINLHYSNTPPSLEYWYGYVPLLEEEPRWENLYD